MDREDKRGERAPPEGRVTSPPEVHVAPPLEEDVYEPVEVSSEEEVSYLEDAEMLMRVQVMLTGSARATIIHSLPYRKS